MTPHDKLVDVLRRRVPPDVEAGSPEVGVALAEAVQAATTAWPGVKLDIETFVARLALHFSPEETLVGWLRRVRAGDLYLAIACAERVPNAIETFDRAFLSAVPAILARGGMRDVQPAEVQQRVRERLFVGACKIGEYAGRGALASWLHVMTLRIAIDVGREQRVLPIAETVQVDDLRLAGPDLELELVKERYRQPFKRALRDALVALDGEQRSLLRLHFVDAMTLEQLAALFHVHRATVARRIAAARDAVFDFVRQQLRAELGIDHDEFEGLLDLLRSRLELSLSALLPSVAGDRQAP